jgi:hypothetical protein
MERIEDLCMINYNYYNALLMLMTILCIKGQNCWMIHDEYDGLLSILALTPHYTNCCVRDGSIYYLTPT